MVISPRWGRGPGRRLGQVWGLLAKQEGGPMDFIKQTHFSGDTGPANPAALGRTATPQPVAIGDRAREMEARGPGNPSAVSPALDLAPVSDSLSLGSLTRTTGAQSASGTRPPWVVKGKYRARGGHAPRPRMCLLGASRDATCCFLCRRHVGPPGGDTGHVPVRVTNSWKHLPVLPLRMVTAHRSL